MDDRMSVVRSPIYGSGGTIAYTDTAANSGNLPQGITGVWVTCTTDAWARLKNVVGATAPVAVTSDMFCPAGVTVFIPNVTITGEPVQLSVVRNATSGAFDGSMNMGVALGVGASFGTIRNVRIYGTQLIAAQLASMTS